MNVKQFNSRLAACESKQAKVALIDEYAEELFDQEKYAEAGKYYAQAFDLESKRNMKAYFAGQAGVCHFNSGEDEAALALLQKSAKLFQPEQPDFMPDMYGFVHFHLGSLLEYRGKSAQALAARQVCEQYADTQEKEVRWMLYAGIGRNYETLGKHDEAIKYSQKAIEILSDNAPGLSYLYESMGNNYMTLQQYPEAVEAFSKVIELEPDFERAGEVQFKLGECYQQMTNDQMALETYRKILELKEITGDSQGLVSLYMSMARCHFRLEQFEKSLLMTLEALRRRPKSNLEKADVHAFLTNNYYELGQHRQAVAEGEKTLELATRFKDDHLFYFRLALSYYKLEDTKSFEKYRTLCRKLFPGDSWNKYLDKLK
jgi:tetratricopeptide (TPR) repeat protein